VALLDQGIAVADTTGLDFDSHQAGARLGDFAFNKFKRPGWPGNLGGTHLWHNWLLVLENSASESGIVPDDVNGQTKIICNGSVTAGKRSARGQSSLFSPQLPRKKVRAGLAAVLTPNAPPKVFREQSSFPCISREGGFVISPGETAGPEE